MTNKSPALARIAMTVDPDQQGHLSSFTTLAKRLTNLGYDVVFVGVADDLQKVENSGFKYQVVAEELYPKGAIAKLKQEAMSKSRFPITQMKEGKKLKEKMDEMLCVFADEISGEFDLIIADGMVPHGALVASKAKIPFITLHATVPFDNPLSPSVLYRDPPNLDGTLSLRNKWIQSNFRRHFTLNPFKLLLNLVMMLTVRTVMGSRKVNQQKIRRKFDFTTDFFPREDASLTQSFPCLIPYPQAFDFNIPSVPESFYVDALIEEDNSKNDFDWDFLDEDKTIVYAAMGSQSHKWMERFMGARFYETLIDAFKDKDDSILILSAGSFADKLRESCNASNIKIVDWAPQKQLLKKVDFMVTHCGIHSVKECIHNEVPMLCFPIMGDQTGGAARVKYHRLGVVGDILKINSDQVSRMIQEMKTNPVYRLSLKRMKEKFDDAARENAIVDIVADAVRKK